jgi:DNA topoisomerase-1
MRLLVEHFGQLMDAGFTARMEDGSTRREGKTEWVALLQDSRRILPQLERARETMKQVMAGMDTGLGCPQCVDGARGQIRNKGRHVPGLHKLPACSFTANTPRDAANDIQLSGKIPEEMGA